MKPALAKQGRPDDILKKNITQLAERNKELNCLYTICRIVEQDLSLEKTLQQIVNTLPSGWQHPLATCARIVLDDMLFVTDPFEETAWRLSFDLVVAGHAAGRLDVYCRPSGDNDDMPVFLEEEKELLEAVARRLGKTIERRRTEAALKRSERRFRDLVENAVTGISILQDNQIVYQNQAQEKLLGPLPRKFVLGDYANIHPDDVEMVRQASRDIERGEIPKFDLDFRLTPAGSGNDHPMKRVFCRVMATDYRGKASILLNIVDMTKIMELEQLLFRQDKMASLGRVAAGIAHEIRNPLSGINIYLNALEKVVEKPDSRPKVDQIIHQLKSASQKIESVIKRVMDFAKPAVPKLALVHINQPINDALNLTAVTLRKSGISIETNLDDQLPACYADPNLIEVAVLNLINNAAEAMAKMEKDKQIRVSTGTSGSAIFIEVSDSGPGVPPELRQKVFDPFFTTKNDGTGIGLSLCHRIVRDHQGDFSVKESALGGAEFRIEIPIRKDGMPGE
jgi:PAS domain S-box-containing protein